MTTSPLLAGALPRLARLAARAACATLAVVAASGARATDVADWHYAAPMPDSMLQFGSRRLYLPPGHWTLVTRGDFRTYTSHGASVEVSTAWAVRIEDGRFRMAIALSLPAQRLIGINRWGADACERTSDQIFQRTLSTSLATPECISVVGSLGLMQYMRERNFRVAEWFETHKLEDIDGLVHILYTKNYNTTFGRISVLLPIQAFESDAELIRWANTLPALLGPFIDADKDDVTLPEPTPPAPPDTP